MPRDTDTTRFESRTGQNPEALAADRSNAIRGLSHGDPRLQTGLAFHLRWKLHNERMITVVGAGFAGVEAAWAAAERGVRVRLYEMRPVKMTPGAHDGLLRRVGLF